MEVVSLCDERGGGGGGGERETKVIRRRAMKMNNIVWPSVMLV